VKSNHHILVTGASPDRKAACDIGKKLAHWLCHDGDLIGRCGDGVGCLGFVDLTFWHCWARWPMIVSSESGQYLVALEYVRLSKVSQLPALIASSQVSSQDAKL